MQRTTLASLAVLMTMSPAALAQDAQSILQEVRNRQVARLDGVDDYVVDQATMGNRTMLYYERVGDVFRLVPLTEIERERPGADAVPLDQLASGIGMVSGPVAQAVESGMAEAGLPVGMMGMLGFDLQAGMDAFADTLAEADAEADEMNRRSYSDAAASAGDFAEFQRVARLVGQERVGQADAFLLRADGLNGTQRNEAEGWEFTLQSVSLWIDTEQHVPLRFRSEGVMTSGGEARPVAIEKYDMDYRAVPGSNMFESYRQVMRIEGAMTPEQEAQMREAQAQLAQIEAQLQAMPQLEAMLGQQLATLRNMASGGGVEVATEICGIRVNSGPPSQQELAATMVNQPNAESQCSELPAIP